MRGCSPPHLGCALIIVSPSKVSLLRLDSAFTSHLLWLEFCVVVKLMHCRYSYHMKKKPPVNIMKTALTTNAIPLLLNGCTEIQPLLQIIDVGSVISLKTTSSHFHITLSDGTHQHKTLLPSAYGPQVVSGDIQIGSIILLKKAACTVL